MSAEPTDKQQQDARAQAEQDMAERADSLKFDLAAETALQAAMHRMAFAALYGAEDRDGE